MPDFVRGVVNLRGIIIPIFDLRARFGGGSTEVTRRHVVVVLQVGERTRGILVDAISDILTVARDDVKPPPDVDSGLIDQQYLSGLVTAEDRMVTLLDVTRLFAGEASEEILFFYPDPASGSGLIRAPRGNPDMSATNSNSFLARLSIIKRLWLAFGLLVVLLVAGFGYRWIQPSLEQSKDCLDAVGHRQRQSGWPRRSGARYSISASIRVIMFSPETPKVIPLVRERSVNSQQDRSAKPGSPIPPFGADGGNRKPHLHLLSPPR